MKKALVTGAAGFIGSNVVRELLKDGVEVRAMIRPGEDERNLAGLEVERVEGNILDPPAIDRSLKGCDTLFHLAAIYSLQSKHKELIYRVNLQGSRNMLWAARRADTEKVVYTSSLAGIGLKPGMEPANEETEFNQFYTADDYVLSKYLAQEEALTFAREGMPIVVVNPCFPFGEGDLVPTPTGMLITWVVNGWPFMYPPVGFNAVDVRDVAKGHVLAAKRGRIGEKYLLGNRNITFGEMFKLIRKVEGFKAHFFEMPLFLSKLYGDICEIGEAKAGIKAFTTRQEVSYLAQYLYFDVSKSKEELGLELTPIEDSIARAIEWFKREGYVPDKSLGFRFARVLRTLLSYLPIGE